jgi:hypothetical protein
MFITADNHIIASFLETVSTISKDIILKKEPSPIIKSKEELSKIIEVEFQNKKNAVI